MVQTHEANSAVFYFGFFCNFDNSRNRFETYIGDNCVSKMIIELDKLSKACIKEMRENQQIKMNDKDDMDFHNANCCYLCKKAFTKEQYKSKIMTTCLIVW